MNEQIIKKSNTKQFHQINSSDLDRSKHDNPGYKHMSSETFKKELLLSLIEDKKEKVNKLLDLAYADVMYARVVAGFCLTDDLVVDGQSTRFRKGSTFLLISCGMNNLEANKKIFNLFDEYASTSFMNSKKEYIDELTDVNGLNALLFACIGSTSEIIENLIENGADINAITRSKITPTMYSTYNSDSNVLKLLIKNKAKIFERDRDGWDALTHAICYNVPDLEKINLLLDNGFDINDQDEDGWTPLIHALNRVDDDLDLIKLLLNRGANPFIMNNDGECAMDKTENGDILRLILQYSKELIKHGVDTIYDRLSYIPFELKYDENGNLSEETIQATSLMLSKIVSIDDCLSSNLHSFLATV